MKVIDKVEVTITWPDGGKDIGFTNFPPSVTGQAFSGFLTMFREGDDSGIIINLNQIAKLEYKTHWKSDVPVTRLDEEIKMGSRLTEHRFQV